MATISVPAQVREDKGKGASRRLRRTGQVPAVVYGANRDSAMIQIGHKFVIHALEDEAFYTSILELTVGDGRRQKVILRDLQRHPFKQQVLHVDFQRVTEDTKLRISVPLHFLGEAASPAGISSGVVISHQMTEVEITCLPADLPENIEVNLETMDVGDSVHLADLSLPDGVEIPLLLQGDDKVVVSAQHVIVQVEPEEEEAAELAEGEEAAVDGEGTEDEESTDGESSDDS